MEGLDRRGTVNFVSNYALRICKQKLCSYIDRTSLSLPLCVCKKTKNSLLRKMITRRQSRSTIFVKEYLFCINYFINCLFLPKNQKKIIILQKQQQKNKTMDQDFLNSRYVLYYDHVEPFRSAKDYEGSLVELSSIESIQVQKNGYKPFFVILKYNPKLHVTTAEKKRG